MVFGDNLDECQNFCRLVRKFSKSYGLRDLGPNGPTDRPVYMFAATESSTRDQEVRFGLYPCGRYEDWQKGRRPYIGHEDPDIIVCRIDSGKDVPKPVFAAEFNSSIPAGNNAWQRFPRIAQAAEKGIPFLYVVPVCDAEVKDGNIRSLRHPNSIIQIGQMILMEKWKTMSLTIFLESPWYAEGLARGLATREVNGKEGEMVFAGLVIAELLRSAGFAGDAELLMEKSFRTALNEMLEQMAAFVETDFALLKGHGVLDATSRRSVIDAWWSRIKTSQSIPPRFDFWDWQPTRLLKAGIPFGKTMSTECKYDSRMNPLMTLRSKPSPSEIREFCKTWSIELDSYEVRGVRDEVLKKAESIPLSYKHPPNELGFIFNTKDFARLVNSVYPDLPSSIVDRISKAKPPLLFLPIAGYVMDTGGPAFSRPDKGLVGLVTTVFGRSPHFNERVVLLYSELVPEGWQTGLHAATTSGKDWKEAGSNNLWRELASLATIVVCDVHGDGVAL